MILKALTAATAAALLALSSATLAQSSGSGNRTAPGKTGASGTPPAGAPADVPSKCVGLTGTEREKCLQDERSGAGSGRTDGGSQSSSPSASPRTPPTSPSTPGSSTSK